MKPVAELLNLSGKAAIVTGGAKGIGYGITYRLAEAEASVLVADADEAAAREVAKKLTARGWEVSACKADVSSESDVKAMVETCLKDFGNLSILVNNAGIYPTVKLADMKLEDFEKVIQVNLRSTFLTTKYASEAMIKSGHGGRIINITSIDALHPSMVGLAHYDASKHGMWGFTKNVALKLAEHQIWVNAVAPGGVQTPGTGAGEAGGKGKVPQAAMEAFTAQIPMRRLGEPDEIGKAVLFLASDMASYMTGSQIVVDGGRLLN